MKLIYPVMNGQNKITQGYGPSQIDYSKFGLVGHNGIDFSGVLNDPVMAAADGVVSWQAFEAGGYGNYVMLQHADGSTTVYGHLNSVNCKKGDTVKAGQIIGYMGSTGNSTGVHLHFGDRPSGFNAANGYRGYIDPAPLLEAVNEVSAVSDSIESNATKVKVVCAIANIRTSAGYGGSVIKQVHTGDEFDATGKSEEAGGLKWREIEVTMNAWIAEHDYENTKIIEDVA